MTDIAPVINTSSVKAPTTAASASTDPLLDKDAFLKLLTAQLQYQDPLSPTDSSTFTTQMSQLSETEQMTNVATDQTAMLSSTNNAAAVALLGKTVDYTNNDGSVGTGVVGDVDISGSTPSLTVDGVAGIAPSTLLSVQ
jgi:flagellar basal-body rod modification protein FlgD